MSILVDTNVLLRIGKLSDPEYLLSLAAVSKLQRDGEALFVTPQNFIEFWSVATRAAQYNGFGLTHAQASQEVRRLKTLFAFAEDTPEIFAHWEQIVLKSGVSGRQVHDARLVAVMLTHNIDKILTSISVILHATE